MTPDIACERLSRRSRAITLAHAIKSRTDAIRVHFARLIAISRCIDTLNKES
jgi:hypothetical protein